MSQPTLEQQRERRSLAHASRARGVIIKVDTTSVEESLFKQIAQQIVEYRPTKVEEEDTIGKLAESIVRIVHIVTKNYFASPLGGQIIDPRRSKNIVVDRIIQFSEILLSVYREYVDAVERKVYEKSINPEEVEKTISDLVFKIPVIFLAIRELINRMYQLLQINAPANERPPLANIKIGYDLLR